MSTQLDIQICFFEDVKTNNFHPLTLTRPVDDLRVGIYTIRQKWLLSLGLNRYGRTLRNSLSGVFSRNEIDSDKPVLWINSRFLPSDNLTGQIYELELGRQLVSKGVTAAALVSAAESLNMYKQNEFTAEGLKVQELSEAIHLEHIWDLLSLNSFEISKDLPLTGLHSTQVSDEVEYPGIHDPENTYIGKNVSIEPGCHILATEGPVVIMKNAHIEAGCIIKGPVVIGAGATVKTGGKLSGGTTIGPVCKVGGEVSNCIFHSYSNKAHDGFAGNSIFGQWVNLGADTNTSNLKNNYSTVRLPEWENRKDVETGQQFLGTVMADHSKTAINSMLNTGTICGVSSNIFISGFPPKYIPSFSWVGSAEYGEYEFEKAIEAMKAMMKRRDVKLSPQYEKMMNQIFRNR
ncbi:putative sugar nucleotidyl transferase [Gracilimonas sp. Q87]|uniref:putative sugar nucleotidyl transferase n=1 Tax=Gracilimonas sp. Q87 TaxID=3384766 RepID=UPI00398417B5